MQNFSTNTIVIGQSPYPSKLIPYFGSAFSQEKNTRDTPTTQIFGRHFEDRDLAIDMIRNNWLMLEEGYILVNADYYSQSLGGGNGNVEYVERLQMMCQYLASIIMCKSGNSTVTILAMGSQASHLSSMIAPRLKANNVTVSGLECNQPASLSRISCNRELIGTDDRYSFCQDSALVYLRGIIELYQFKYVPKASLIFSIIM